jgi:Protein of unknown function (DUF3617)
MPSNSPLLAAMPLLALVLTACSGKADGELNPGNWKQTVTIKSIDAPKAPPQARQALARMAGKTESQESCMGPVDAKEGVKGMSKALQQGGQCEVQAFDTKGGKISGKLACKLSAAGSSTIEMGGTYDPDHIVMTAKTTEKNPQVPGGEVVIGIEFKADRAGECKKS